MWTPEPTVRHNLIAALALGAVVCASGAAMAEWVSAGPRLKTRWATDVSPERPHPEYPRPHLVRPEWQSLNGLWQYAIRPRSEGRPSDWDGDILVPFAVESSLSGVARAVGADNRLWYRTTFDVPEDWKDRRLDLHFEAVDWHTEVWLNGALLGSHRGGYDATDLAALRFRARELVANRIIYVVDARQSGHFEQR